MEMDANKFLAANLKLTAAYQYHIIAGQNCIHDNSYCSICTND